MVSANVSGSYLNVTQEVKKCAGLGYGAVRPANLHQEARRLDSNSAQIAS